MPLIDILKKKKDGETKKIEEVKTEKGKKGKELKKEDIEKKEEKTGEEKTLEGRKVSDLAWWVLYRPHITEKAMLLAEQNQYIFEIHPKANKKQVKKAIEDVYGVHVESVRITKTPPKLRRRGRQEGWKKGVKKAIVRIKEGEGIEVLPK